MTVIKFNFIFKNFEGEVFDAFIEIIPNFYSSKANVHVKFLMVCFDGVDTIS